MGELVKNITNVQRFELLEERLGISISSVGASLVNYGTTDEPMYHVEVNAEIIAINGGEVADNFKITVTASDSQGTGLGGARTYYDVSNFFGIDTLRESIEVYTTDVEMIKIFPVKY